MASLKIKKGSPFWWIKHRNDSGKIVEIKTQHKIGCAQARRMANAQRAELASEEAKRKLCTGAGNWEDWVTEYFEIRYASSPKTLRALMTRWNNLRFFLKCLKLNHPRLFQREHGFRYMTWRKKEKAIDGGPWREEVSPAGPGKKETVTTWRLRKAKHNTALIELKALSLLFKEAVRRKYVSENPLAQLGIKKEDAPEKPAMTDAQIARVRQLLAAWPRWMTIAFEIALFTGCRLFETCVFLEDVWIDEEHPEKSTIAFRNPKGGHDGNKDFRVPLRPELIPMFKKLKAERPEAGQRAYDPLPPEGCSKWWTPARAWYRLFHSDDLLKGCTFHCTRVSFVSRGAKANVAAPKMMKLVNHSSMLVHRIYQRLTTEDLADDAFSIPLPPAPAQ
jgi:integrase